MSDYARIAARPSQGSDGKDVEELQQSHAELLQRLARLEDEQKET